MHIRTRVIAFTALAIVACGAPAQQAAPSPTPTPAATATATPTLAAASPTGTPAPPHAGVGAASVKVAETKSTVTAAPARFAFIGELPEVGPGTYVETMNLVTLQPGGRTVSHRHAGVEIVIVVEGSVEVRTAGGKSTTLAAGQTAKVPANTAIQALNAGTTAARFVALFITADGQPFQTNLESVP